MKHRIALTLGSAVGGLVAAAFLPVAVAFADTPPTPTGPDAFTIDGLTYDPFTSTTDPTTGVVTETEGWSPATVTVGAAPLFELGVACNCEKFPIPHEGGNEPGWEVYSGNTAGATDLGTAHGQVDTANFFGIQSTQVTIEDFTPSTAATAAAPTVGSVYDVTDFGRGIENIYWAIPGAGANGGTSIHDALHVHGAVIPILGRLSDTTNAFGFNVGDGFAGLVEGAPAASAAASAAASTAGFPTTPGPDAFTLGGITYDPFTATGPVDPTTGLPTEVEGWGTATESFGAAPWFEFGQVAPQALRAAEDVSPSAISPAALAVGPAGQSFEVYNDGTDIGQATGNVDTMNFLGIQNTQVTIENFTESATAPATATAPMVGSVYDVTDFGSGIENIYWAVPGANGAPTSINDVLDLFGKDIPIMTSFDATNPFAVGDGFAGLDVGIPAASAAASAAVSTAGFPTTPGPDAFTFSGITYDPFTDATGAETEGWGTATESFGAAPWFEFGQVAPQALRAAEDVSPSAIAAAPQALTASTSPSALSIVGPAGQSFEVYNDGTDIGQATGSVDTMNFLGIQNTQVTIEGFDELSTAPTTAVVPTVGSVYDVTDFGSGMENIYWAIPGVGPNGGTSIHDVLDLFGMAIPLMTSFDATNPFDVGDGFAGLDVSDPLAFLGL